MMRLTDFIVIESEVLLRRRRIAMLVRTAQRLRLTLRGVVVMETTRNGRANGRGGGWSL